MHNKTQYSLLALLLMIGLLPLGCGQTEYTGVLNHLYNACRDSDGIEYHPEDGSCFCPNGIVCEKGAVCDNTFNTCIEYKHENILNCHDITNEFALADGSFVLEGKCNDDYNIHKNDETKPSDPDKNQSTEDPTSETIECTDQSSLCGDNTVCNDGILYYYFNGDIIKSKCPYGCSKDNKTCEPIKSTDNLNCNSSELVCVTINDSETNINSKQYQCKNNVWEEIKSCDGGCDITMRTCINTNEYSNLTFQRNIAQYYKKINNSFVPVRANCNTPNTMKCDDCTEAEKNCYEDYNTICNEHGVWEKTIDGRLDFDENNAARCVHVDNNKDNSEQH